MRGGYNRCVIGKKALVVCVVNIITALHRAASRPILVREYGGYRRMYSGFENASLGRR